MFMQERESSFERVISDHVFLFPGQGNPAIGMGAEVCDVSPVTTAVWDCASDFSGVDVRKLCRRGPMTRLTRTRFQQLAVTTVSVAMFERLREFATIERPVFAGHSAGEYAALYAAGAFDLPTLFKAITARANLMEEMAEASDGVMYVVKGIDRATLQGLLDESGAGAGVQIANDNSPRQQVLSGTASDVKATIAEVQRRGYDVVKLPVNGAWHSVLMAPAVPRLREALRALAVRKPVHPVYMNLSARVEADVDVIVENLCDHLTHTVRWRETMETMLAGGRTRFAEMGAKRMLAHMLASHYPAGAQLDVSCFDDWSAQREPAESVC
ncbi:ACP S-malonyltransferase [Paraburkholderia pallida]|uniref:Malonyl CoA-acyl carrier protein transacylase n=1 Tax=Paraburkholderia pallida TaxID=2547399 RepID=A0A4P7CNF7_9BURK|nr:ACP S-malonyltransferase [Paraburkholderia pallida]QBQ96457.1 ACP S-malonyltransferase [Paraburkholderia pallida]